jgi:hypothetical protein
LLTVVLPILILLMSPVIVGLVICICIGQYRRRRDAEESRGGFPITPKDHT